MAENEKSNDTSMRMTAVIQTQESVQLSDVQTVAQVVKDVIHTGAVAGAGIYLAKKATDVAADLVTHYGKAKIDQVMAPKEPSPTICGADGSPLPPSNRQ